MTNECIVCISISLKNYSCKYHEEIYIKGSFWWVTYAGESTYRTSLNTLEPLTTSSFCSISEGLQHTWQSRDTKNLILAIRAKTFKHWNHPLLQWLSSYQIQTEDNLYKVRLNKANWNFIKSGHGKGAPDGVGGSIKRLADRPVSQVGVKIENELLKKTNTSVTLYFIEEDCIQKVQ